jgi:hypothetical protein
MAWTRYHEASGRLLRGAPMHRAVRHMFRRPYSTRVFAARERLTRLGASMAARHVRNSFLRRAVRANRFWNAASSVAELQELRRVLRFPRPVEHNYGVRQVEYGIASAAADRVRRVMRGEYV